VTGFWVAPPEFVTEYDTGYIMGGHVVPVTVVPVIPDMTMVPEMMTPDKIVGLVMREHDQELVEGIVDVVIPPFDASVHKIGLTSEDVIPPIMENVYVPVSGKMSTIYA
jgi:hypothetical protein